MGALQTMLIVVVVLVIVAVFVRLSARDDSEQR